MSSQDNNQDQNLFQSSKSNNSTLDLGYQQIQDLRQYFSLFEQEPNLNVLILKDNRLNSLPEDLSILRQLRVLDLRNNPLQIQAICAGLQSLQNLRELFIDVNPEQENFLRNFLGNEVNIITNQKSDLLQQSMQENRQQDYEADHVYNKDQQINKQQSDDNEITLKQEDLEQVAITFDQIRELYRQNNPSIDQHLANSFDEHVKNVMEDLSIKVEQKFPEHIINTHIIKAKYLLYEICFSKVTEYLSNIDPNLSQILKTVHDTHASIIKDLSQIIMKQPAQKFKQQYAPNYLELKDENEQLKQQLRDLQLENKKYLDQIIKHSKGIRHEPNPITKINDNIGNKRRAESPNFNMKQIQHFASQSTQSVIGSPTVRSLTMRQLKDVIEEIYKSKEMFDKKYLEAQLPRETMEQHMYTYLNQKYGLKNLIIEWATAILNGIRKFKSDDNDIAVFGKILRNECDEEFRFVQNQVKNTIQDLLKMYLRGRYPYKYNQEIKDMMSQKVEGWIYEEEAVDILKYMYNTDDAEILIQKLQMNYSYSNSTVQLQESLSKKKITREQFISMQQEKEKAKIEYIVFQKIILDFQLKSHEQFLKTFITLFRSEDLDLNGVVDESEFRNLLKKMEIVQEELEVQGFLAQVDPYNKQQITFSQCVTLFSAEIIEAENGQKLSILQKIQTQE